MDGDDITLGLLVILIAGSAVAGKLFGPRAESIFMQGFWIVVFGLLGALIGLILVGLIWTSISSL